jgi:effector-binding domain-containing protein
MRSLTLAAAICLALFVTAFAEKTPELKEGMPGMAGTVKITVAPAIKHVEAFTAVTAYVKAADLAPEGGWGEKDHTKAYQAMSTKGFELCSKWMEANNAMPTGPAFSIYFESPEETKAGDLTSKSGFPIRGKHEPAAGVAIEEMPAQDVASVTYMGDYAASDNAWKDLMKFVEAEGYVYAGAPMEIYHVWPGMTQKPEEWVTEVQWPVKKAEAKPEEGKKE